MRSEEAARRAVLRALANVGLADTPYAPTSAEFRVEPLAGGIDGRSYAASARGSAWVVRVSRETRGGAVDVGTEARIARAAAALGIAPRVIAVDPDTGTLITERLRGSRPVTSASLKTAERIAQVARLLRRLHTIRVDLRAFDPQAFAADYLAGAAHSAQRARSSPAGAEERALAAELRELAREYRARYPSRVPCHNDLVASNILDDGELKLVDFEYAVQGAPVLDIAGLAALNDLDEEERWRLAEAYYEGAVVPFTRVELGTVVRLVRLIAYFWAVSAAARAENRGPYDAFADRMVAALAD